MENSVNEEWRPVVEYEGFYEISNYGRVKSLSRISVNKNGIKQLLKEKIRKPTHGKHGYLTLHLNKDNKVRQFYIHRLVAEAFIPNPDSLPFINHKDENKQNNHVSNLEWCTPVYNVNYGTAHDRMVNTQINNGYGGKPVLQYSLSGEFIKEWQTAGIAAKELGLSTNAIRLCCLNYSSYSQSGGFQWKDKGDSREIGNILPIIKCDLQGNEICRYESIVAAARENGINPDGIMFCINGKYKQSHGFIWKRTHKLNLRSNGHKEVFGKKNK